MSDKLDKEEQELLESFENDEWQPIKNMEKEIKKHREYAKNTFLKNKRINIRISEKDLDSIQRKALEEGIPYQTLISSVLHKYVNGKLVDKDMLLLKK